jgi:hypothetical protein
MWLKTVTSSCEYHVISNIFPECAKREKVTKNEGKCLQKKWIYPRWNHNKYLNGSIVENLLKSHFNRKCLRWFKFAFRLSMQAPFRPWICFSVLERRACSLFNTLQELSHPKIESSVQIPLSPCELRWAVFGERNADPNSCRPNISGNQKYQSYHLCHPGSPSFRSDASGCIEIETFFLNFTQVSPICEYLYRSGFLEDTPVRNP